jgi:type I restriction enzyme S subunit
MGLSVADSVLGEVPSDWLVSTVGVVFKEFNGRIQTGPFGSQLHASDYVEDGIPTVMPANIGDNRIIEKGISRIRSEDVERLKRHKLQSGDIVFSRRGDVERRSLVRDHEVGWLCGTGCLLVRPPSGNVDSAFLSHWFGHPVIRTWLTQHAIGATMLNLNTEILSSVPLVLPPLKEQLAIAEVLGAIDDKIESNHRLQLLLDAVIEAEYARVTNGSSLVHFSHSLHVVMGAPFGGDHFSGIGHGRPLIRIRDLKTFAPQTWTIESRADEVLVRAGDVVVGMDAEFRSTLWVGEVGLLNQRVCKFVPKAGVATAFAWHAIRSDLEYCERAKSGTTVIHLNKGDIDRFSVPELDSTGHQDFSDLTEPMLNRLVSAGLENLRLVALRDALLPELLSGRLRVKDAKSIMECV